MKFRLEITATGIIVFLVAGLYANSAAPDLLKLVVEILLWLIAIFGVVGGSGLLISVIARLWAETTLALRNSAVMVVTAEQNQQIFIRDSNSTIMWHNTALEPRTQFGHGSPNATLVERQQWLLFKQVQLLNTKLTGQLTSGKAALTGTADTSLLSAPLKPIPKHVDIEPLLAQRKPSLGSLILGVAENDEVIRADARQLFHILVSGSTRWGKSIFLQMFLYQLLHLNNIQVYLADLEENTFVDFGLPFAATRPEIEQLLKMVWDECKHRKEKFTCTKDRSFRTLEQYNSYSREDLPYVFVFLDEINGLFDKSSPDYSPDVIMYLNTLGKRVAKYGVYIVACGQDLRANVMPSAIRNQFISMLQFKAQTGAQARNLIEDSKAHKITVKGRAYVFINELGRTLELQVPFIEQETIASLRGHVHPDVTPYTFNPELTVEMTVNPSEDEQEVIDLYHSGESMRKLTHRLYGQHGKFYNEKFWREVINQYNIPMRSENRVQ